MRLVLWNSDECVFGFPFGASSHLRTTTSTLTCQAGLRLSLNFESLETLRPTVGIGIVHNSLPLLSLYKNGVLSWIPKLYSGS